MNKASQIDCCAYNTVTRIKATVYFFILFLMKNTNLLWFNNRANDLTKQ